MEYKTVIRPYDLNSLIGNARGKSGSYEATCEAGDWNSALNDYAKKGWIVKSSNTVVSGRDIIFWALLEKP
jgi:hypothetical protein